MKAILRVIDSEKKEDYNLEAGNAPVQAGPFIAYEREGTWLFHSEKAVSCNTEDNLVSSGVIRLYDSYLIDQHTGKVVLVLPSRGGSRRVLSDARAYTVGRNKNKQINTVELHDRSVSAVHCMFYKPNKKHVYVADLDSTTGTFVNYKRLTPYKPYLLKQGDVCAIGPYSFRIVPEEKESFLSLDNCDTDVFFHPEWTARAMEQADRYFASIPENRLSFAPKSARPDPVISVGPRKLPAKPEYEVTIESAPSLYAQKPGLGGLGLGMNLPMMAIGFGTKAINYAFSKKKYTKAEKERADFYAKYITKIENELIRFQEEERSYALRLYPGQSDCQTRMKPPYQGLWERHPGDEDFLSVRFGTGDRLSRARIQIPPAHLSMQEDVLEHIPEQIRERYSIVNNMPVTASLINDGVLGVVGAERDTDPIIRNLVLQIAALHGYDHVKLVLLCNKEELPKWEWMRWLPHTYNDTREYRYIITEPEDFDACFRDEMKQIRERINPEQGWNYNKGSYNSPVFVFVVISQELLIGNVIGNALVNHQKEWNLTGIVAGTDMSQIPHSVTSIAEVKRNGSQSFISYHCGSEEHVVTTAEKNTDLSSCDSIARSVAPVRLTGIEAKKKYLLPDNISFFEGLGLRGIHNIHPESVWGRRCPEDSMNVPIGIDENQELVWFDIHEKVHGVHGLVAGKTGSGKSKMVQSWIGSMAYHFSPEDVNFVLVDFKGESLITPFRSLPHLACFTSNLDPDVSRKFLAVKSELERRQELLRQHSCEELIDYRKKRRKDKEMPNIPFLILVVDEFASFKTEYPEFTETLDQLFQKGRALGFFAVVMTQNPSGKVTDQMRANLGFRWCLKVDSDGDSREVIDTPDAAQLRHPGRAYFKANGVYKLLQAFYGEQPYDETKLQKSEDDTVYALKPNGLRMRILQSAGKHTVEKPQELKVLSDTLKDFCESYHIAYARPIWQPALPEALDLAELLKDRQSETASVGPAAVLGLFDDPAHQRQSLLIHDLWEDGTMAVYGAPQSGKTTFLETYMLSLARRYSPEKTQFYILECGDFRLESYKNLPHTGGYSNDSDPGCVKRIIEFLVKELSDRKYRFHKYHVSSCAGYEDACSTTIPVISLLIDNVNSFLQQFSEYQMDIVKLIKEGAAFGILVIMTVSGTGGMYSIAQFIRRTYGLRLADRSDYSGLIASVKEDVSKLPPGRGFLNENNEALRFQTAVMNANLPDIKRYQAIRGWIEQTASQYDGPLPEQIMSLPEELFYGEIKGDPYVIGLDSSSIQPYTLHIEEPRSLLISYTDDQSNHTMIRSFIRQTLSSEGEVYLYSKKTEEYEDLLDKEHIFSDVKDMEEVLPAVSDILRERQEVLKESPGTQFKTLLFIIDGMKAVMNEGSDRLFARLEVFIRLGEGLNYAFIGTDRLEAMNDIAFDVDNILAFTAREGYGMILGGQINDHRLFTAGRIASEHPDGLSWDEAVVSAGGKISHVKVMQGD